jgi:hypothetical protein
MFRLHSRHFESCLFKNTCLCWQSIVHTTPDIDLVKPWNKLVRHTSTVFYPFVPILLPTPPIISNRSVIQQDRHVGEVKPRQDVVKPADGLSNDSQYILMSLW